MKITKLEYQKKDPNRVNVYVDEKYAVGLDVNALVKLGLYKNQEISQEELNKIIGESEFGKLFNYTLNFLSYRPRSEWEIRHKLKFKSKEQQLINNVIDKLKKIGQINDVDFAKWFIDQRQAFRPTGRKRLKYELSKKGIKNKIISQTFENNSETERGILNESQLAARAVNKLANRLKLSDYSKGNLFKTKAKLQRFLAGRGFDWETIDEEVDKILKKGYTTNG